MDYFNSNKVCYNMIIARPTEEQLKLKNNITYKAVNETIEVLNFKMLLFFSFYKTSIKQYLENYICDDIINNVLEYLKPEEI